MKQSRKEFPRGQGADASLLTCSGVPRSRTGSGVPSSKLVGQRCTKAIPSKMVKLCPKGTKTNARSRYGPEIWGPCDGRQDACRVICVLYLVLLTAQNMTDFLSRHRLGPAGHAY